MLNILHHSMEPQIASSVVATENQEATNLISSSSMKRSLGFLAYSCVKPPVDLTFDFMCPINLHYIIIWANVGVQRSTGFEVVLPNKVQTNIGFGYLTSEPGIVFYRGDIYSKYKLSTLPIPPDFCQRHIKTANTSIFNVQSVTIRIIKTNSSIPAIGKIEIWGEISKSCPMELKLIALKNWKSSSTINKTVIKPEVHNLKMNTDIPKNSSTVKTGIEIPDEFLDMITYEIMSLPLILPSGKIIDQSTLDKHSKTESIWGRASSDPFTGLTFNEMRKPFMSFALKMKIDKFLLDNSECKDIMNVARTVGRTANMYKYTNSQLVNNTVEDKKSNINVMPKIKNCLADHKESINYDKMLPSFSIKYNNASTSVQQRPTALPTKHKLEEPQFGLTKSLKLAINAFTRTPTISRKQVSLPMVKISKTVTTNSYLTIYVCMHCSNKDDLFKIPCSHLICRTCLVILNQPNLKLTCTHCESNYESKDVIRYHNV